MRSLLLFVVMAMLMVISAYPEAGEKEPCEFGCKPWVDCMPCEGGWCYIEKRDDKKKLQNN